MPEPTPQPQTERESKTGKSPFSAGTAGAGPVGGMGPGTVAAGEGGAGGGDVTGGQRPQAGQVAPLLSHWAEDGPGQVQGQAQVQQGQGVATEDAAIEGLRGLLLPIFFGILDNGLDVDGVSSCGEAFADALRAAREAGGTRVGPAVESAIAMQAPDMTQIGNEIRDAAVKLANDSSLMKKKEGASEPVFPTPAGAKRLGAVGSALSQLSRDNNLPASAAARAQLAQAAAAVQDGALAVLQSLSVMAARQTWSKGKATQTADAEDAGTKGRERSEVDEIFKDMGGDFGNRQTVNPETGRVYDWCGFFVASSMMRGGGLAKELRAGLYHVDNVKDFFQYQQKYNAGRVPLSVWAEGQWWDLPAYHEARGSARHWTPRAQVAAALAGGGSADIRPGDVCLIDHDGGNKPSHIVMVESYDAATGQLVTIEGNTIGIRPNKDGEVEHIDDDHVKAGGGRGWTGNTSAGLHVRDLNTISKEVAKQHPKDKDAPKAPKGAYQAKRGTTVWGVGRPSLVDYEEGFDYAVKKVPEELRSMSPDDMREMASKKPKGLDRDERKQQEQIKKIKLK